MITNEILKNMDLSNAFDKLINNKGFQNFINEYFENYEDIQQVFVELKDNFEYLCIQHKLNYKDYLYKEFKTKNIEHSDRWILIGAFTDYSSVKNILWFDTAYNQILENYSINEFLIDIDTNIFDIIDFKL